MRKRDFWARYLLRNWRLWKRLPRLTRYAKEKFGAK